MSPYADSIGWLSEDPSTPVEPARIRISKEAATKPISQQAEEFVDHYHQLPSSIIEEAINATFVNGSLSALKISQFQKSQQLYSKRWLQQEKHLQIIFRAESHKLT
ncbi:hypothetical protein Taro_049651 [Colocasia esculenta]|uniref:Uncharacterized protein n=1 Tax=Colocasia esculenta TaxID=4460 RepID=A0A843XBJ7_COLES|nr:hypothetical protein [Colocasia esculenta]